MEENATLTLDQASQFSEQEGDHTRRYQISFGNVFLSQPTFSEPDGDTYPLFPQEARLRNLTYSAPLFVHITTRVLKPSEDSDISIPEEIEWVPEIEDEELRKEEEKPKMVFIGKVPIMLRSIFCVLSKLSVEEVYNTKECPHDDVNIYHSLLPSYS